MFSFGKLLVLALMIWAVVLAYRWRRRFDRLRAARARERAGARVATQITEDMVKCRVCGVYVPARGTEACQHTGCPYRR